MQVEEGTDIVAHKSRWVLVVVVYKSTYSVLLCVNSRALSCNLSTVRNNSANCVCVTLQMSTDSMETTTKNTTIAHQWNRMSVKVMSEA